jgi:hypothetical protein
MTIDTRKAPRRKVRFTSVAELDAELDRIERADLEGRLKATGNWTPGQILGHIATWLEFGWCGYPPELRPPAIIKGILRLRKNKYLRDGMPVGVRIPGLKDGTLGTEPISTREGLARLRKALEPLRRGETQPHPSPAFGALSASDCAQLNLRHAELHLSFLNYD